jgi:conjugative relaxase-like TrwC/TraI family protein
MGWEGGGKQPGVVPEGCAVLRVIVQGNAAAAQSYYKGGSGSEYYAEGQEHAGEWGGLAAERLALEGGVEKAAFDALCENKEPGTGERITARTKTIRRVGFDLNFHVPKSISVVYGLTGDRSVLDAFKASVRETMAELETDAQARVRVGGKDESRTTGNHVYSLFVHSTSRPVGGVPDPHLHAHCFVFNLTFDPVENRWKALELGEVYKNAPYYEAVFHACFARKLVELGYDVSRTATGWELSGVPSGVLKTFSRRTAQVETLADELGVTDPALKGALGAKTRERKQLRFTLDELRTIWNARLTHDNHSALEHVLARDVPVPGHDPNAARDAMAFAIGKCFERSSVIPVKRLLGVALRHGVGQVTPEAINDELTRHGLIVRDYQGERLATTKEVLAEETRILTFAKRGRNACRSLVRDDRPIPDWLSPSQQAAVRHVLTTPDRVILVRGVAGSGKTTLIRECVNAIEGEGKKILLLAPSAEASRGVLRKEGFADAETVAKFLLDERLRETVRNGVVWIDEAGLLGLKTLDAVFRCAGELAARVVLSGDDRQHHAVERGSPFMLLHRVAGLEPATVKEIRRQKGRYKEAIELLSEGKTVEGFDLLDRDLGWVQELRDDERTARISADYVTALEDGKSILVVSPTHAEGTLITRAIRAELRTAGKLVGDEIAIPRLVARDLTLAERQEPRYFREGDVVEFHSQAKGFRPGTRLTVTTVGRSSIAVKDATGLATILPLTLAERFQVYTATTIAVAVGDHIRITKNGRAANQRRLDNGTIVRVTSVSPDGGIELEGGAVLPPGFCHITHGYVVTSHASQGKTVDRVLIAQSSESFRASSREQFYVSASRGRVWVTVYTDDKQRLRRAIERSDPNFSASDLVHTNDPLVHVWRAWVARRLRSLRHLIEKGVPRSEALPVPAAEHIMRSR